MNDFVLRIITGSVFGLVFFGSYILSSSLFILFLLLIFAYILIFEWPQLVKGSSFLIVLTIIYPILPMFTLIYLCITYRVVDLLFPLYPYLVSWTNDTCAYIVGKTFGRCKICPTISPGKSWAGLFGGFLGIFGVNYFMLVRSYVFKTQVLVQGWLATFFLSAALAIVAFLGDIFISYLKRRKHLKDTGSLLPGHGGFLDRFDSVLFVVMFLLPFFFLWIFFR